MCHFLFQHIVCVPSQSEELAENVSKIIDSQLADAVDMSEVQVTIWHPIPFTLYFFAF